MSWRDRARDVTDEAAAAAPPKAGGWMSRAREVPPAADPEAPGAGSTFVRRASDTVFPFTDELAGAVGAGVNAVSEGSLKGFGHDYRFIRDAARRDLASGAAAHPTASKLGTAAGIALSVAAPIPKSVGPGALGAFNGLGASEADLTSGDPADIGRAAVDTAAGAALGHFGAKAIGAVGARLSAAAPALERYAGLRAYKASGKGLRDYRTLGRGGRDITDEAARTGNLLMDTGAVRFGNNVEEIGAKMGPLREATGKEVGEAVAALDAAGVKLQPGELADAIEQHVIAPLRRNPVNRNVVAKLEEEANQIRTSFKGPMSASRAEELKRSYDPLAYKSPLTSNAEVDAVRGLRNSIRDSVEEAAIAQAGAKPAARFLAAKDLHEMVDPAAKSAADQVAPREANRAISPTDYLAGHGAAAHGEDPVASTITGAIAAILHKQVRERGASAIAVSARALGRAITNPAVGKYAPQLAAAAARSPEALLVLHRALTREDPAYADAVAGEAEEP